jgi:hypothetical protein
MNVTKKTFIFNESADLLHVIREENVLILYVLLYF